jgi:hypothetical protein
MGNTSRSEFEILVRRAGLSLPQGEVDELYQAWSLMGTMLERVRGHGRDRGMEPAQIFRADAWIGRGAEGEGEI